MKGLKDALIGLALGILSLTSQAQQKRIIKDSLTGRPIPYVNIWVENEMIGATSDINGSFQFEKNPFGKKIILSSIGYKRKTIQFDEKLTTIFLIPDVVLLKEIVIGPRTRRTTKTVGDFKKSNVRHFFGCSGYPSMIGKYFPYTELYADTPFLGKIEVLTASDIHNARFNIRLYTMNEAGMPDKFIFNESILGTAKKGTNLTTLDISDKLIEIPRTGVLVAIEFLITDSNKHHYEYTMVNQKEKLEGISYEPAIGTIPSESGENSWQYIRGMWNRAPQARHLKIPEYQDKFTEVAVKLTLTD
jgi:hypothetical protein